MRDQMLNPEPVPMGMQYDAEAAAYPGSVRFMVDGADGIAQVGSATYPALRYPITRATGEQDYEPTRAYTDRIKLQGYVTVFDSSMFAEFTDLAGNTIGYTVHDVEYDGDFSHTTLLAQKRGIDPR